MIWAAALELLNKALIQDPCHPDIVSDRGFLYIHLKRHDLAMEDFDLSMDLQPDYAYRMPRVLMPKIISKIFWARSKIIRERLK